MYQVPKAKKDYSKPFVSKIEERLESDFSKPNNHSTNTLANDLASLARYLHEQGLSNSRIAQAIDVEVKTVTKWTEGKHRNSNQNRMVNNGIR